MAYDHEIIIVYDGECPFCRNYCKLVRMKDTVGSLRLVDARESSSIMQEVTDIGLDIDQGMVVKFKSRIYYGSDAINVLSLLSSHSDWFNRINFLIFRSKRVSLVLYPFLRTCRNFALWLLNIPKIDNLKKKALYEQ